MDDALAGGRQGTLWTALGLVFGAVAEASLRARTQSYGISEDCAGIEKAGARR